MKTNYLRNFGFMVLLIAPIFCHADVHKCNINGKIIYTDKECSDKILTSEAPINSKKHKQIDWNESELEWFSYEEGLKELASRKTNGIFIIYTDWCPACQQYSRLFKHPKVVPMVKDMVLIRSNKDREPHISKKFNINGEFIPRTFALDPEGKIISDLNVERPKWWYYIPSNNPYILKMFARIVKEHESDSDS